jgi:hypothetical protein
VDNNEIEKMKKIASLDKVLFMVCVFVFAFAFVFRGRGGGYIVSTYYEAVTTSSSSLSSSSTPLEDYTSGLVEGLQQILEVHENFGDKEASIFRNKAPYDVANLKNVY